MICFANTLLQRGGRLLVAGVLALTTSLVAVAPGAAQSPAAKPPEAQLLVDMIGTWNVTQRMWTGPGATANPLPPAIAVRRIPAGGGFIVEEMRPADPGEPFTRQAQLNYDGTNGRFEYASLDSRAPQLMHYRSQPVARMSPERLRLTGGRFVAADWGGRKNVAFAYRIELTPVAAGRQRLDLYLRPLAGPDRREFRAFEYRYVRR